eukprot:TRINITY_DN10987_c0_g1_i1.p1 TRINITY_DN10987_c0_g1~~TRINITY_DN10987_c0_g1_i1.p1  ORF type:complete len:110 (+),score=17.61 TRINITY_DN10987_c0_g1_i1:30-359(+)
MKLVYAWNKSPDDTECDDGDGGTKDDKCISGVCAGTDRCGDVICTPLDQCHIAGVCDRLNETCSDPDALDGTSCDDTDVGTRMMPAPLGSVLGLTDVMVLHVKPLTSVI